MNIEKYSMQVDDVAQYLRVSRSTVYNFLHDQRNPLPGVKIGREWRFNTEEIDRWVGAKSVFGKRRGRAKKNQFTALGLDQTQINVLNALAFKLTSNLLASLVTKEGREALSKALNVSQHELNIIAQNLLRFLQKTNCTTI